MQTNITVKNFHNIHEGDTLYIDQINSVSNFTNRFIYMDDGETSSICGKVISQKTKETGSVNITDQWEIDNYRIDYNWYIHRFVYANNKKEQEALKELERPKTKQVSTFDVAFKFETLETPKGQILAEILKNKGLYTLFEQDGKLFIKLLEKKS